MSDAAFLDVAGLSAGYGRSQVLFGVSLTVPARGAVAVLGRSTDAAVAVQQLWP